MNHIKSILNSGFLILLFASSMMSKDIIVITNQNTIQSAIDQAKAGDVIKIAGGLYFESLIIKKSGINIVAHDEAQVKITSAYPEFYHRQIKWDKEYSKTHHYTGRQYDVYSAPYPKYRKKPKGLTYGYVAEEDDELYFTYRDRTSFDYQFAVNQEVRGVYFDEDRIYLASERDPNNERLFVSDRRILEIYNVGDISIDGGQDKQISFMHGGRYGIIINQLRGKQTVIRNLRIINCHSGIMVNSILSGTIEISNNSFNQYLEELPWEFQKTGLTEKMDLRRQDMSKVLKAKKSSAAYMETSAILASKNGSGTIKISNNDVFGYFNGIVSTTNDVEIAHNTLSELRDDAIEIEGNTPNNIIHHNEVSCSFVGISLVPIREGPVFIYQNEILMNKPPQLIRRGLKSKRPSFRNGKTLKFTNLTPRDVSGDVHIYDNRFFALDDVLNIGSSERPEYNPRESSFFNNVFISKGLISSSFGRARDGINYQGNLFNSLSSEKKNQSVPENRNWKNMEGHGINRKKSEITYKQRVKIPNSWPGSKTLNQNSN